MVQRDNIPARRTLESSNGLNGFTRAAAGDQDAMGTAEAEAMSTREQKEMGVTIKKCYTKDLCYDENVLYIDCSMLIPWLWFCIIILQYFTTGRNWGKDVQNFSELFISMTCECTIISK